jgi:diaminopimelate decarboxylase
MNLNFKKLAEMYGTPLYVYDFDKIENDYMELKRAFEGRKSLIAYAVKANSNLSLIKHLSKLDSGADCVSIGEIKRALKAGIKPYKIIFSGVGKSDRELREALDLNILFINVESEAELKHLESVAKSQNREARLSIRVNPNVNPKTHPYISTGLSENKFGVEIDLAKKMYLYAKNSPHLNPIGVHFHIGSQLTDILPIKESVYIVADLVKSLKAVDIDIRFFDVGGGLGIKYRDEETISPKEYAETVFGAIKGLDVTVISEPGRYLTANAGYLITKVLYEKSNSSKRFVIVDGAMNDLLRPSLYKAYHRVEFIGEHRGKQSGDVNRVADIVGPICESGDWLAKDVELPITKSGDLIVVHSVGAYGFTMSSNYNTRGRAVEVACENGECRVIRDRELFEDLIRLEEKYLEG